MQIRKRNGQEVEFDKSKIQSALTRANSNMTKESDKLDQSSILDITNLITDELQKLERTPDVEDIQDMVQKELCKRNKDKLFEEYTVYRFKHAEDRRQKSLYSKCLSIVNNDNNEIMGDNLNKNPLRLSTQRDYLAGTISKEIYSDVLLPKDISEAHREGIIHQHDADYSIQHITNCCLSDMIDMLWNGTKMNEIFIHRAHSFSTACTIATQVIVQISSSQFGGQTLSLAHLVPFVDISRQQYIRENLDIKDKLSEEEFNAKIEKLVRKEINRGIQTLQFQTITISCSNGQTPFITLAMFRNDVDDVAEFCRETDKLDVYHRDFNLLVEEVLNQRIEGVELEDGTRIAPIFPKLIYCIDSTCCDEATPNWYLTELASKCTLARMVPDYVSEKIMIRLRGLKPHDAELRDKFGIDYLGNVVDEQKFVSSKLNKNLKNDSLVTSALDLLGISYSDTCFSSMGCRSQLSVWRLSDHPEWIKKPIEKDDRGYVKAINNKWYNPNKMIKYSRFNIGVTTINIPDVALSAYATKEDVDKDRENGYAIFWKLFDERLELCHRAIRFRFDYLLGTKAEVAPIQWMNGNFARLGPEDKIDELLKNGFCTASLGYVGLYETVKWLTGESHTQENGRKIGMQIMQFMYDKCQEWKNKEPEHIGYSMYGTPEESTTLKFAKALQRRHGIIEGITDKNYVTNSYHIPVFEGITHGVDAFTKLSKEAPFQDLSSGGNISYVELPAMNKNLKALQAVIKHIYDTNIYAEINTKLDYCQKCGYEGEILLEEQTNRPKDYHWKCPNCGNTDTNTMYIVRRVCGYLASMSTGSNQGRLGDIHDREVHL